MRFLIAVMFLFGCGKAGFNCTPTYAESVVRFVGPFEHAKCEPGEVAIDSYLEYEPGGKPKWLKVECSKLTTHCE